MGLTALSPTIHRFLYDSLISILHCWSEPYRMRCGVQERMPDHQAALVRQSRRLDLIGSWIRDPQQASFPIITGSVHRRL